MFYLHEIPSNLKKAMWVAPVHVVIHCIANTTVGLGYCYPFPPVSSQFDDCTLERERSRATAKRQHYCCVE